ncbi:alpha/beta fold hydrolase [Actinomycetospora termitidis]|uniref:Alpha/beta hydrolase n=1 Tax=Actinomycetospora termitidis TaxID=3053470 RepID=A0ABT7MGW7_9PSEU|nr:alpha/beta hydrolase [Actinomycetospora sp. Odt1-22]MDL5159671.1 alpha/beta hydrolase [Actinomycetospora sp. Odt1-22]
MSTPTATHAPTEADTIRFAQTKSWRLRYNEAGSGHPVLLLHGSGPGATGWSNYHLNIPALAERFRVIAWDAPGWGQSDAAPSAEYDHPAAVIELLDELGIEKAALVGNSMGGMVAVAVAARYPDRVSHLITMGSGSFPDVPPLFGPGDGPSEGLKILIEGYRNPTPATMMRLVQIMTFAPEFATEELAAMRAEAASARPDHLENFLEGLPTGGAVSRPVDPAEVRGITAPTMLVHGRDDRVVHHEHSLRLLSMIPDARLVLFNRCGHWAQIEHAAEFNRLVSSFVAES